MYFIYLATAIYYGFTKGNSTQSPFKTKNNSNFNYLCMPNKILYSHQLLLVQHLEATLRLLQHLLLNPLQYNSPFPFREFFPNIVIWWLIFELRVTSIFFECYCKCFEYLIAFLNSYSCPFK